MTVTISEAGGGQWMLTITDGDGTSLASTAPTSTGATRRVPRTASSRDSDQAPSLRAEIPLRIALPRV
jgi:hypothetical protein